MLRILAIAAFCFVLSQCDHKIRKRWVDIDNATFTFDCSNRAIGFYADVEYDCQIFHMCDPEGRRIPHSCANDTSFNQEYRICDWENNFDCSEAPKWYYLNELTYATDPPKSEDEDYIYD
ncbi:hypothetical protein MTP99_000782 [Tenebrio molitor]|jgi:hypothetical protein|uniref:U-scoloptoxin(01)-Er1a isoform X1 n=1 Tax=Tenebrio molitor TaxID=7067 RepID=UPI001C3BA53A|nr:hypothetical protein MTP99_000782 [Tenebrio molitor]CAH1364402.1 unnamed protein product [Tenebrio molitor]